MTTPIQKMALDKLKGTWTFEGSLEDEALPIHVFTSMFESVEITRAEAEALRGWFQEQGLREQDRLSVEDLVPGQFSIFESGNTTLIVIHDPDELVPKRDVEYFPKPKGDLQDYSIKLHRDDFLRLHLENLRDGWFTQRDVKDTPPTFRGRPLDI